MVLFHPQAPMSTIFLSGAIVLLQVNSSLLYVIFTVVCAVDTVQSIIAALTMGSSWPFQSWSRSTSNVSYPICSKFL